jgi:hypothetical protein
MQFTFDCPLYEAVQPMQIPDAPLLGAGGRRARPDMDEHAKPPRGFPSPKAAPLLHQAAHGKRLRTKRQDHFGRVTIPQHVRKDGPHIAFPRVPGPEMQHRNPWEASLQISQTVLGVAENSLRGRMKEAARIAGLACLVNVVLDVTGNAVRRFCGDIVSAPREASALSREVNGAGCHACPTW